MIQISSEKLRETAIGMGRTKWLRESLQEWLPSILKLTDRDKEEAKKWDSKIKEEFARRGLKSLSQQKNRITDIRNAIKVIDPDHPALDFIGLSPSQWLEVNNSASSDTDNRTTQLIDNPEAIVEKASSLLFSPKWSEVAAGLAVVTGRRISEILKTAQFALVSEYSVNFTGALKRREETESLVFEIPTLVPAVLVVEKIKYLREKLDTQGLTNRQINDKYEQTVARECDRAFKDLVPTRDGKNNLYTHLFRAVYATIATHWYCPPTASDLEFRAYIQGHFKVIRETNRQKRLSLASQKHYWDYKIGDGKGNIDGRLGIKLNEPEVKVIEAFAASNNSKRKARESLGEIVNMKVWKSDRDSLARIQEDLDLKTRYDANHYVLEMFKKLLVAASERNITPQQLVENLSDREELEEIAEVEKVEETKKTSPDSLKIESELEIDSNSSNTLIEKMDRQQESLSDLTDAIHSLVRVLRESPRKHSSAENVEETNVREIESSKRSVSNGASAEKPEVLKTQSEGVSTEKLPAYYHSKSLEKEKKVNRAIDRMMAHNNKTGRASRASEETSEDGHSRSHEHKWKITVSALIRIAGVGQSIVYRVYNSRKDEIEEHNKQHHLGIQHNKKGEDYPTMEEDFPLE